MAQKQVIYSHEIQELDEIGCFTEKSSILFEDGFDGDEEDDYYQEDNVEEVLQSPPTYERYNGSYAQDVMGYSDDEIDTIFDGDPLAYWNTD